jgi:hypothetical protein
MLLNHLIIILSFTLDAKKVVNVSLGQLSLLFKGTFEVLKEYWAGLQANQIVTVYKLWTI